LINIYYCWFVLWEGISHSNTYTIKTGDVVVVIEG